MFLSTGQPAEQPQWLIFHSRSCCVAYEAVVQYDGESSTRSSAAINMRCGSTSIVHRDAERKSNQSIHAQYPLDPPPRGARGRLWAVDDQIHLLICICGDLPH
jgi:hypothetical protein